jgi:hypothetical protein
VERIFIVLAAVVVAAALGAGAWEIHRVDGRVATLRSEEQGESTTKADLDHALAALSKETAKIRASGLRLEFQLPVNAYLTQTVVAVYAGALSCEAAKRRWQNYVNGALLADVNKHPVLRAALRHDDPDYHATLLNAFPINC